MTKGVPKGFHSVTPYLVVRDAERTIAFYRKAFGAEEVSRIAGPDGKGVGHAEIRVGDTPLMLSDENPAWGTKSAATLGGSPISLHIYVADTDAAFQRAVAAGCKVVMPPADMFWGDRYAKVLDPDGIQWGIATNKETVAPEELERRAKAFYIEMAKQQRKP
jgi:uncharacterized glyoxalase superfamily protein PhnB